MGYLFGDIFAVTTEDLYWIYGGGAAGARGRRLALAAAAPRLAVHEELAAAEGVEPGRGSRPCSSSLLAVTIAIAIKIVGVLLVIAFLIVPAVAARPFSATPERMAVLAGLVAVASVVVGPRPVG